MFNTQITQWGNSQGIRIPKQILESLSIAIGENVNIGIDAEKGCITIKKAFPSTFSELIDGYEGDLRSFEWDTGDPQGKEVF